MIDLLMVAAINATQPLLPTTKEGWAEYQKVECDDSQIGKTTTLMGWFWRCFAANFEYEKWLQQNYPQEYERLESEQHRKVREMLQKRD